MPLADTLMVLLEAAQKTDPDAERSPVTVTSHGKPGGESGLLRAFRRVAAKVGLVGFRYHDLRHFFVTELFRQAGSARAV